MVLFNVLLQVFSLDSADLKITKNDKCWYILKCVLAVVVIGVIDAYSLYWKIMNIFSYLNPSIVITDVCQMTYDYVQYIIDLIFVYKYGRELGQEYLKNYDNIDKILDMTHHTEIKGRIFKLSSMILLFWLVNAAADFYAWSVGYGIWTPVFYGLAYIFTLIKILTNIDLTVQVLNVECRLRVIGDLLQDCYESVDCLPKIAFMNDDLLDSVNNKNWFYGKGCSRTKLMRCNGHPLGPPTNSFSKVKMLTRCYLLIIEQCMFINKMFGIRILLNSLSLLIDMVRFLNVVVRISINSQRTLYHEQSGYMPAMSTFLRFLNCVAILTSLVYHCERVYANTVRIISVTDHILINKNPDEVLRSSLTELRGLVTSRPIAFNICNFFNLGYPYLVSMISVVCTYTIILLQNI